MMQNKVWLCAIIFAGITGMCEARPDTAGEFLTFGLGARASGMGEAFTAVADDSTAVYWNPAGLACQSQKSVTLMHNNLYPDLYNDIYYDGLVYASPVSPKTAFGIGITYLHSGSHDIVNLNPATQKIDVVGSFQTSDLSITGCYAKGFDNGLSAGMNIKYISSKTYYINAESYAADFGVMYQTPVKGIRLGAVLKDWGKKVQNVDHYQSDGLPTTVKAGAACQLNENVLIAGEVIKPLYDKFTGGAIGVEAVLTDRFVGRVGYFSKERDCQGLTYGAGIMLDKWQMDVASLPTGKLGKTNRVSVSRRF
ncbi:MAG: PorV/PorQ family protein [Candidatus Desantisbacteria bacterium]